MYLNVPQAFEKKTKQKHHNTIKNWISLSDLRLKELSKWNAVMFLQVQCAQLKATSGN